MTVDGGSKVLAAIAPPRLRFAKPRAASRRRIGTMRLPGLQPERSPPSRSWPVHCARRCLVWLLAATLLMPVWMLPRAAAMLPLAPVQNPSEEESHSSHSVAAQLQQLSATSGGRDRRPAAGRSHSTAQSRLCRAATQRAQRSSAIKAEIARRNGCGAPLRC